MHPSAVTSEKQMPFTSFISIDPTGGTIFPEYISGQRDTLQEFSAWDAGFDPQIIYSQGSTGGLSLTPLWGSFTMDDGWVGLAYDEEWALEYCATPCTFSVVSGSLPLGLTLSSFGSASGKISGTPTTAGSYSFTLRATNAFGSADKAFSITINTPPASGGGGAWTFFG